MLVYLCEIIVEMGIKNLLAKFFKQHIVSDGQICVAEIKIKPDIGRADTGEKILQML